MSTDPHADLGQGARELLRQRAEAYGVAGDPSDVVLFGYADTRGVVLSTHTHTLRLGIPLSAVQEVVPVRTVVRVPRTPMHLLGLTRLRGRLLSLVDIRRFWGQQVAGNVDSDIAVVVQHDDVEFGLLCSGLDGLVEIADQDVSEVPSNMSAVQANSLRGIADRDLLILDPERLLRQPGFIVSANRDGE